MTAFTAEQLPPFTTARLKYLANVRRGLDDPDDAGFYETCSLAAAVLMLRARLELAVDALERYHADCAGLSHAEKYPSMLHGFDQPCPVEARIAAIIAACREPNHITQGNV